MNNGIERLEATTAAGRRAAGQGRAIPPSRHKPRATPVVIAMPETADDAQAPAPRPQAVRPPLTSPADDDLVARRSVFLTSADDAFLEAVYEAGRFDPAGRFDVSKSAVIRAALAEFAADKTPAEVVAAMRKRAPKVTNGRPRR